MTYPFVLFAIIVLLLAGLVMSYFAFKLKRKEYRATGKYPRGHYMGQGFAIGIAIGIPIAIVLDNIFTGYLIGLVSGSIVGSHLEKKHEYELRPLTPKEKDLGKKTIMVFGILFALGLLIFGVMLYLGF
ncbi:MAG: hypothetical protein SCH66_15015 [Methanolobus sp.]|nr:hypothetical protein [Methanolobus sp.]